MDASNNAFGAEDSKAWMYNNMTAPQNARGMEVAEPEKACDYRLPLHFSLVPAVQNHYFVHEQNSCAGRQGTLFRILTVGLWAGRQGEHLQQHVRAAQLHWRQRAGLRALCGMSLSPQSLEASSSVRMRVCPPCVSGGPLSFMAST